LIKLIDLLILATDDDDDDDDVGDDAIVVSAIRGVTGLKKASLPPVAVAVKIAVKTSWRFDMSEKEALHVDNTAATRMSDGNSGRRLILVLKVEYRPHLIRFTGLSYSLPLAPPLNPPK